VNPWKLGTGTWLSDGTVVGAEIDKSLFCTYQCSKWRKISIQSLLLHSGAILAGGLFIERLTNWLTSRYGFQLITRASDPAQVESAIRRTLQKLPGWMRHLHFKRTICIIGMGSVCSIMTYLTPRLDQDGFYTVDYYVTAVFLFSVVTALFFRSFHPYHMTPMVFTEDLWVNGHDTFVVNDGSMHKIDLYDWFHTDAPARAGYLLSYARTISLKHAPYFEPEMQLHKKKEEDTELTKAVANEGHEALGPLQARLLDIDSRLDLLEGKSSTKSLLEKSSTKDDKNSDKGYMVECVKDFCGFSDVFVPGKAHSQKSGGAAMEFGWERTRVVIQRGARGEVMGKTHAEQLMVAWNNDEKTHKHDGHVVLDEDVEKHHMVIDPQNVLEVDSEWERLQDIVTKAEHKHLRQTGDLF